MKTIFKKTAFIVLASVVITSCVDEKFNTPVFDDCVSPGLVKNKEITALYTTATNTAQNYTADDKENNQSQDRRAIGIRHLGHKSEDDRSDP